MLLGDKPLGARSLGQISGGTNGVALGATITVTTDCVDGVARGRTANGRFAPSPFVWAKHANGSLISVGASILAGSVSIGHEVTVASRDGDYIVTLFGCTDEELRDPEFVLAIIDDDWELYNLKRKVAA